MDYKYIPEGNIPPIEIPESIMDTIRLEILPWDLEKQLSNEFILSKDQLQFLLDNHTLLPFYRSCMNMESISQSLRTRFFWQEYLTWYKLKDTELSPEQVIRLETIDLSDISTNQ